MFEQTSRDKADLSSEESVVACATLREALWSAVRSTALSEAISSCFP
jgi:hypothetical protein